MQTGTIIYLTDAKGLPPGFDVEAAAQAQGLAPEWTEVAASAPGYYGVPEALLELAKRGAGRVDLVSARRTGADGLAVGAGRLRVLG